MDEKFDVMRRLELIKGEQAYNLAVFGDHLAKRNNYKAHSGIDAVHFYLVQKHNWLPSTVKAMKAEDLIFCLEEEMVGWVLPKGAIADP